MFRVLIIEDEEGVRKGLVNAVNWSSLECEVCSEADSGLEGFEKIIEYKPDIVISDIVMPGIDGLTLLSYLKEKSEDIKVILITGYREFDYAKEALKLGAYSLLTKPVNLGELKKVIISAVLSIKESRHNGIGIDGTEQDPKDDSRLNQYEFLEILLKGKPISKEAKRILINKFFMNVDRFIIITVALDTGSGTDLESIPDSGVVEELYSLIKGAVSSKNHICTIVDYAYIAVLVPLNRSVETSHKDMKEYASFLHERIKKVLKYNFSFGISSLGSDWEKLSTYYRECHLALRHRFFKGKNSICYFQYDMIIPQDPLLKHEDLEKKALSILFENGSRESTENMVNQLIHDIIRYSGRDEEAIKGAIISLLTSLIISACGSDIHFANVVHSDNMCFKNIVGAGYLSDITTVFKNTLFFLKEYTSIKKENNKDEIIRKIYGYMEKYYHREITLREVADSVYMSRTYLSSFIKIHTNKNFTDILNEIRIKNAKDLLNNSQYKIYEISEMVGFSDPHYFSQVFKRIEGLSPSEYLNGAGCKKL